MSDIETPSEISFGWGDVAIDFALLLALPVAIIALQYSAIIPTEWIVLDLSSSSPIAIYGRLFGHISAGHLWANVGWLLVTSLSLYGLALWTVEIHLYRSVMVASILGTPPITTLSLWLIYSYSGVLPVVAGASDIPLALLGATIILHLRLACERLDSGRVVSIGLVFLASGVVVGVAISRKAIWPVLLIVILISVLVALPHKRGSYYRFPTVWDPDLNSFEIWYGIFIFALLVSMVGSTLGIGLGPVSQIAHIVGFLVGVTLGGIL